MAEKPERDKSEKIEGITIRVSPEFEKILNEFMKKFSKEIGIKLSFPQATKLIAQKIIDAGGLIV